MAFSDLDRISLHDFINQEKDEDAFWLFMHIPKTAGTSFSASLRELIPPYKNIMVDYSDNSKSHNEKLNKVVDDFISLKNSKILKSASGHIPFDLVSKIRNEFKNTKVVTFLRDPVSRVISDFRYQRTPEHPPYLEFIERFPSIEDYIDSVESQNKMAEFIAGRDVNYDSIDMLERLDSEFCFVGLLEMYPLSFNVIFNLFGHPGKFPTVHSRKTPDTDETKVHIDNSIIENIMVKNSFDVKIFNHVNKRLLRHRDDWAKQMRKF